MLPEKLLYWASKPVVRTFVALALKMEIKRPSLFPQGAKFLPPITPAQPIPFLLLPPCVNNRLS